mgnify:CR=1 FL=1
MPHPSKLLASTMLKKPSYEPRPLKPVADTSDTAARHNAQLSEKLLDHVICFFYERTL